MAEQAVWRIARHTSQYAATDLSGDGAKVTGGRWNRQGAPVIYASSSIALATLETLAHLGNNVAVRHAFLVRIAIPAALWKRRQTIDANDLPLTWLAEPPGSTTLDYGDAWLKRCNSLLLLVPSVIVPEEHNVLINPAHADARRLSASVARQYISDARL